MSQFTWTNPGSYWRARSDLVSWSLPFNPNLQGGGAEPFYQLDWPNPPLGYPYPTALRTTIAQHPPWTVWNPNDATAGLTLSGDNLTATNPNNTLRGVRATISETTGKFYWEIVAGNIGNQIWLGVANATFDPAATQAGNSINAIAIISTGAGAGAVGQVKFNNVILLTAPAFAFTQNDVVRIACDFGAQLIWFSINGGPWNGDRYADPALGTRGLSFSGLTGAAFPLYQSKTQTPGSTANFGATLFTYAVPNAFKGFDGQSGTTVVGGPPMVATDWPNPPLARFFPNELRTSAPWLNPNLFGGGAEPFYQLDWPNPRGAQRGVSLADISAQNPLVTTLATVAAAFPPPGVAAQYDWPNPRGYVPGVSLKTHLDGARLILIGQDRIYGDPGQGVPNYDWPNPRGYVPGIALRSWSQSLLQGTLAPFVQRQSDWPNPRGYVPAISLRTHLDPLKLTLRGQDRIYGGPGQGVPNYDWPNPRGYVPSISLRSWSQNLLQSTIAPIAQRPGSQTDWPNPRGYAYPVSLRTTINPRILPPPIDWVTPPDAAGIWVTQGDASSGTWTTQSAAAGFWTTQPDAT